MATEKPESKRKGGGDKLARSVIVTVRMDAQLNYLADLAARKQRRFAEHRHAIGQGVRSGARGHLVDEAFGEEGGVAVGVAAPAESGRRCC